MLDIHFVRENAEAIKLDLGKRRQEDKIHWLEELLEKDRQWRQLTQGAEELKKKRNELTEGIKLAKGQGKNCSAIIKEAKSIPGKISETDSRRLALKEEIDFYLMRLPNLLHSSVPVGESDRDNVVMRIWGKPVEHSFDLKPHGEFLQEQGLADFVRAAKIAGTGFYFLRNELALLDLALAQFAIHKLISKGYSFLLPPLLVNREAYQGVTDLADFETVMYKIDGEELYLIATSEHAMGPMFKDEILSEKELPKKLVSFIPCFRREIGKHGIDTRGLFRVHQFNKVEQFIFCTPEDSWKFHEELISNAEELFQELGLPYRVVNVCTGDIGTVAAKKYDLEVWMPREKEYREAVSCSNCTAYQAVRTNTKYRKANGEKEFVHTLNATAIATSRAIRAIVENFQDKDGAIKIPQPLQKFMNGLKEIKPNK